MGVYICAYLADSAPPEHVGRVLNSRVNELLREIQDKGGRVIDIKLSTVIEPTRLRLYATVLIVYEAEKPLCTDR